jgi:hypothetical protein
VNLEVLVPEVDSGPGGHVGNNRYGELTASLLGHDGSGSQYRREWCS